MALSRSGIGSGAAGQTWNAALNGAIIMVKRVSSKNRRKGHVRPGNVKRRVRENNKAAAQMQAVLGRSNATPAAPSEESAQPD